MSKETTMSFRLEPNLRQAFQQAVEANHRPAGQVLRELMRGYIAAQQAAATKASSIDAEERAARRSQIESGIASVFLEGLRVPDEFKLQAERFIEGEIDHDELMAQVHQIAKAL